MGEHLQQYGTMQGALEEGNDNQKARFGLVGYSWMRIVSRALMN